MNQDWNVGDLTKVIYGSDNSSSRSKFNRDIFAKIRQFAKKTDKGVFVPRYVKGKKPRRKTNRRVEKINGEEHVLNKQKVLVKFKWSNFLNKWKKELISRGIDKDFEKEMDIIKLKEIMENEDVRSLIFDSSLWGDLTSEHISIYGFFTLVLSMTFFSISYIKTIDVTKEKNELIKNVAKAGLFKSWTRGEQIANPDLSFFEYFLSTKTNIDHHVLRDRLEKIKMKLRTLLNYKIDVSCWNLPIKMSIPESFLENDNRDKSFNKLFIEGKNLEVKISHMGNTFSAGVPHLTIRDRIDLFSPIDCIYKICFS